MNMKIVRDIAVVADGDFPLTEYPRWIVGAADAVVCCDGAIVKYLEYSGGQAPDAVVGDMDTLSEDLKTRFGDIVTRYEEQDYDDLAKAVRYCLATYPEVERIHILGATGGQEDFTLGNYGLLMEFGRSHPDISFEMVSDHTTAFPLCDSAVFDCGQGRTLSIFSPDPELRISSQGLEWPLDGVCFDNWWKGIRNRSTADRVALKFSRPGLALVILD